MNSNGSEKVKEKIASAEMYLHECCSLLSLPQKHFSEKAKEWIERRNFDENKKDELRRLIFTAALLSSTAEVDVFHFPPRYRQDHEAFFNTHFDELSLGDAVFHKLAHFFERLGRHEVTGIHRTVVEHVERPMISLAIQWAEGNHLKAARLLGMHRNTLRAKIKQLDIK